MFSGRYVMMNVKFVRNAVYTMSQRNYGRTIGPRLPITVFTSTVGGGTLQMTQTVN